MGFDFLNPLFPSWNRNHGKDLAVLAALQNPLIVARVLSFLEVETVKISRRVCKIFAFEAAKHLSNRVSVRVGTNRIKHKPSLPDLALFLSRHNIQHRLNLSLLPLPNKNAICISTPDSENVIVNSQAVFRFLALVGELVTELRLEFCLSTEEDAALFLKIVGHLPHLVSLHLKFEMYQITGFLALDRELASTLTSVRSLSLHFKAISSPRHIFTSSVPALHKLLQLFPLLNHLDTSGCTHAYTPQLKTLREFCYRALLDSDGENTLVPHLTGITLDLQYQSETELDLLLLLPFKFQKLHLFLRETELDQVTRFVSWHSATLTNLHLTDTCCGFGRNWDGTITSIFETLFFPALTTLRVDSYRKTNFKSEQSGPGTMDLFGLRQLFLNGSFETAFPNLTSLTVVFFMEFEESCWEYIFPDIDKDGTRLEISQLKRLSMTFAGDCDSLFVLRLMRIFPELVSLSHTKLEFPPTPKYQLFRDKFSICWTSKAYEVFCYCCCCIFCCQLACICFPKAKRHWLNHAIGCLYQSPECCPDPDLPKVLKDPPPTLRGCEHVKNLEQEVVQLPFSASNFLRPFPCKFFRDKQIRRDQSYYAIIRPIWK